MTIDAIKSVAVLGTGQMGPGIAVATTLAGFCTLLIGRSDDSVARGVAGYEAALAFLAEHEAITAAEAAAAQGKLTLSTDLRTVGEVDLIVESIVEHLPTKQEMMVTLESLCGAQTFISSNTSGLRITDIAALMAHPERAITTHFWNPAHLMPLVEVIQGERTADATVDSVYAFCKAIGKEPVVGRKDMPGQVCNRLFQAVIREAIDLVEQGIASPEGVETAIKAGMGLRFPVWGPLEHLDAVGLDLGLKVQATVLPSLCRSAEPAKLLSDLVAAGNLGAKTGHGFHDWTTRSMDELKQTRDLFLVERYKARRA
jgi:3-hydroxybutyryl-CoA dehydrogenase